MKTFFFRWLPLIASLALIFLNSANHNPYLQIPSVVNKPINQAGTTIGKTLSGHAYSEDDFIGKPGHLAEFFILGMTAANAFLWKRKITPLFSAIILVACALYALSDEIHQIFVPGRDFQTSDLFIDCGGILIGILIYKVIRAWKEKRLSSKSLAA